MMKYQSTRKCDGCGELKLCLWENLEPGKWTWLCGQCNAKLAAGEALADIVKATEGVQHKFSN